MPFSILPFTKLLLVNLGFFMRHIYWSEISHLFYTLRQMFTDFHELLVEIRQNYGSIVYQFIDQISRHVLGLSGVCLRTFSEQHCLLFGNWLALGVETWLMRLLVFGMMDRFVVV